MDYDDLAAYYESLIPVQFTTFLSLLVDSEEEIFVFINKPNFIYFQLEEELTVQDFQDAFSNF